MTTIDDYINAWKKPNKFDYIYLTLLIEKGVDPNMNVGDDKSKLMWAAFLGDADVVSKLINLPGVNVNATNSSGWTALHFAKTFSIVRLLVEAGANINAINNDGETPIMTGDKTPTSINHIVTNGADRTIVNNQGKTIYDMISEKSILKTPIEIVQEQLVQIKEEDKITIAKSIAESITKEQKSKLIQDIIGDMIGDRLSPKPLA
jgi:hypothetical protein